MSDGVARPGIAAVCAPRATVFIANAAIMTAELTAGKLVSPYLGMSLYTWTAIIGVIMGGMTLGYHAGGFIADRFRPLRALTLIFLLAAVALGCVIPLNHVLGQWPVLSELDSWPLRIAGHVFLLYFGPAMFLGAVSPVVARMALRSGSAPGVTLGGIFASGVAGSIAGTFCTGYYLAYVMGVWQIMALCAGILGALAVLHLWFAIKVDEPAVPPRPSAEARSSWKLRMAPNITVFVSNAGFMMLEIAASRDLARHFGGSLFTWTTIIGVVLAGISFGNYLGGRIADRSSSARCVAWLFALAAGSTLAAPWIGATMREMLYTRPELMVLSWPMQIFLYTTLAFFLPCVFVGMITPVVVRRALDTGRAVGGAVGSIYAWGALGCIVGVFASGYWLIDWMGSLPLIAAIAVMFALATQLYAPRSLVAKGWTAVCAAALVLSLLPGSASVLAEKVGLRVATHAGTVVEDESQYSYIAVLENPEHPGQRSLLLDMLTHSTVDVDDPKVLGYEYAWICEALVNRFHDEGAPVDALVLGGGGFVFPHYLEATRPGSRIVTAEIDPAVIEMAHEEFGLPRDTSIEIHGMDARNLVDDLLRPEDGEVQKFDCIFGDSISDYTVPQHMTTLEFAENVQALLKEDGFYTITAIDVFDEGRFLAALIRTCRQAFSPYVFVMNTGRPTNERDTFVVISANKPINIGSLAQDIREKHRFAGELIPPEQIEALLQRTNPPVLTDNYAPVENLLMAAVRTRGLAGYEIDLERAKNAWAAGDAEGAIEACKAALEAQPTWADAWALLAAIEQDRGDLDAAIEALETAISVSPDPARLRSVLASVYVKAGRAQDALGLYEALLEQDPSNTGALLSLGRLAFDAGDVDAAEGYWQRAVDIDADFALGHYNLGQCDANRRNFEAAIVHYERAVALDPNHEDTRHNLASSYLVTGQAAKAKEQLDALRAIDVAIDPNLAAMVADALKAEGAAAP